MRTVPLALVALAACGPDYREAGPAATAATPDTAERFLSEYGFRIPPKDTAEFLGCDRVMRFRPAGLEYLTERCLPLSAVPPEGLKLCKDPRHQAPASGPPVQSYSEWRPLPIGRGGWGYYCPDAPEGTPVRVVTAADLAWIRSTLSGTTVIMPYRIDNDPDREALAALRKRSETRVR